MDNLLPVKALPADLRAAGLFASAIAIALARLERAGRRPPRLLEADHKTWGRFRGRLGPVDFLALLMEDAAVVQACPFDPASVLLPDAVHPSRLTTAHSALVGDWLGALNITDGGAARPLLDASPTDYITAQARRLGLPTQHARHALHRVRPHHRVLELPGTGGQLSHYLATTYDDLDFSQVFTIATAGWRDHTLAGLCAADLGQTGPSNALRDPDLDRLRLDDASGARRFDYIIGSKDGIHTPRDLQSLFQHASPKILLV